MTRRATPAGPTRVRRVAGEKRTRYWTLLDAEIGRLMGTPGRGRDGGTGGRIERKRAATGGPTDRRPETDSVTAGRPRAGKRTTKKYTGRLKRPTPYGSAREPATANPVEVGKPANDIFFFFFFGTLFNPYLPFESNRPVVYYLYYVPF